MLEIKKKFWHMYFQSNVIATGVIWSYFKIEIKEERSEKGTVSQPSDNKALSFLWNQNGFLSYVFLWVKMTLFKLRAS